MKATCQPDQAVRDVTYLVTFTRRMDCVDCHVETNGRSIVIPHDLYAAARKKNGAAISHRQGVALAILFHCWGRAMALRHFDAFGKDYAFGSTIGEKRITSRDVAKWHLEKAVA